MKASLLAKKSIGTSVLIIAFVALALVLSGQARALMSFISGDLDFTATVTQVDAASFQVDKGGTYPFTIVVNGDTDYDGDFSALSDVEVGDEVVVAAREDQGMLLAESVESISPTTYGYGSACEPFVASELWVSAIEDGVLFLSRANITFEAQYDGNTEVMPGDQSVYDLEVGETIAIVGDDCNSDGLVLDTVVRNSMTVDPGEPGDEIVCEDLDGYVLFNSTVLLSHDEGGAFTPLVDVDLPAGAYYVDGISFDHHTENAWDTLTNESWYVEGYSSGELVFTSESTDDLPDGVNRNFTEMGMVVFESDVDQIRYVHSAYVDPTYQSITPECVAFDPLETDIEEEVEQGQEESEEESAISEEV